MYSLVILRLSRHVYLYSPTLECLTKGIGMDYVRLLFCVKPCGVTTAKCRQKTYLLSLGWLFPALASEPLQAAERQKKIFGD